MTETPQDLGAGRELDEAELAERLRARDPRALADLYDVYGPSVFGFLLGALRERGGAEDVQQQVFLEVWQRAPTFDPDRGRLLTWIMTIARSRAIDHLRRRVPEPVGSFDDEGGPAAEDARLDELVERWRLSGLLRALHPEESHFLRLRFYEDLSQSEIAERTGVPLGTVKMRMVSGLRRLRELMAEEER